MVRFKMSIWYGTLLISEYGITIIILMVMVHFMVFFITWWLYMLYDWLYVVYSSDYSFLNIVSAKLLSVNFISLTLVKLGFVKCLLNGEHYKRMEVRS